MVEEKCITQLLPLFFLILMINIMINIMIIMYNPFPETREPE